MKVQKIPEIQRRRILLTNGRFPVALDLARQLKKVGHTVFTVDPMQYHVLKFSSSVKRAYKVPAPHVAADAYVDCIREAVKQLKIHVIIPLHEEILYLAQVDDLRPYLFAPNFHTLLALHNKWSFYQLTVAAGLAAPPSILCKSMDDIRRLDLANTEYALKPVFGRALSGIHHHKPGEPVPELEISETLPYIAQVWIHGKQLCSYAIARGGEIKASAVYPVIDTIDGSSCVYFESVENLKIKQFMEVIARTYNITGQLAFDFIETPDTLYSLECNPRATSGIHLFNKTSWLADAFMNPLAPRRDAIIGKRMQMLPGMLMWDKGEKNRREKVQHTRRLFGTHDILFTVRDPLPALMQPFLYVTYKKRCHDDNLILKELFQWDVIWEATTDSIQRAYQEALRANDNVTLVAYGNNSSLIPGTPHVQPSLGRQLLEPNSPYSQLSLANYQPNFQNYSYYGSSPSPVSPIGQLNTASYGQPQLYQPAAYNQYTSPVLQQPSLIKQELSAAGIYQQQPNIGIAQS